MSAITAVGVHAFAGGFTSGALSAGWRVREQLEVHELGSRTVESLGVRYRRADDYRDWELSGDVQACYGNPRCTSFSCLSARSNNHGPRGEATEDARQLVEFATSHKIAVIAWESVQQVTTVGRDMLDEMITRWYGPRGYRVAYVLHSPRDHKNSQWTRRRCLVVAYLRSGPPMNLEPPPTETDVTTMSVLEPLMGVHVKYCGEDRDLTDRPDEWVVPRPISDHMAIIPHLLENECLNRLARRRPDLLTPHFRIRWETRTSRIPFSLFTIKRLKRDCCRTISSGFINSVHPSLDRTVTVRETAALMGWPGNMLPLGKNPTGQVAKGVVPRVATWVANEITRCLSCPDKRDYATRKSPDGSLVYDEVHRDATEKIIDLRRRENERAAQ